MALGVTIDFNANLGNITGQVDRMNSQLNRFQVQAETMSSRVSKAFGALGVGLSIAGIGAFVKSGIDAADALSKMASKTGIAVEELAGLKLAADLSDTSLETLGKAVNKLSVYMTTYASDAKGLGITSKDNSEAFAQLADVLTGIDDAQTRAALGTKILGRSWQDLAPLLLQGGEAIREQVKQGKELNPVTTEMALQAAAFNDSLTIQEARLKGVATQMAGPFVDAEAKLLEYLIDTNTELGSSGDSFSVYRTAINETVIVIATLNNLLDRAGKGAGRLAAEVVALAHLDFKGYAVIEEAFKEDITNAQTRYEKFVSDIRNPSKGPIIPAIKPPQTDAAAVATALGVTGTSSAGKTDSATKKRIASAASVDKLKASADGMIANLQRELALRNDAGEAARVQYDIVSGSLKGISAGQAKKLTDLAAEKDAVVSLSAVRSKLVEVEATRLENSGHADEAAQLRINNNYLDEELKLKTALRNLQEATQSKAIQRETVLTKAALGNLNTAKQMELSRSRLNSLTEQSAALLFDLQDSEQRIAISRNIGFLSEQQAMEKIIDARKDYIAQQEEIIRLKIITLSKSGSPQELQSLNRDKQALDNIKYGEVGFNQQFNQDSSLAEFDKNRAQIGLSKDQGLDKADANYQANMQAGNLDAFKQYSADKAKVEGDAYKASFINATGYYSGIAATAADTFMGVTKAAVKMYGEQSKQAKIAFALYKATAIAQAIIATAQAVTVQLGAGPWIGFVLAGLAGAMGAVQIAQIASQQMPAAHGGLDYVPKEQTFLLDKGERVISPRQNKDLTGFLQQTGQNNSGPAVNITVNVQGTNAPDVRRAAGQGAREALSVMNGARRYA